MRHVFVSLILTISSLGYSQQQQQALTPISVEQLNAFKIGQGLTRVLRENPEATRDALIISRRSSGTQVPSDKVEVMVKKIDVSAPRDNDPRLLGRTFKIAISVNRYGQIKDYNCDVVIGFALEASPQYSGWFQCESDVDALYFNRMANGILGSEELF